MLSIRPIEKKIEAGTANDNELDFHIKLLQEVDKFDNFKTLDLIQKARIKWDIKGHENSKFFHGLVKQKWRSQMIHGIMKDGVWISDLWQIKDAFLNFFKVKFEAHDLNVDFPQITYYSTLSSLNHDSFELVISLDEVKNAIWDCVSVKALGPNGFSFAFVKKY
ncbi:hypothetical protein Tco_0588384 [Tanacetum coccineum]